MKEKLKKIVNSRIFSFVEIIFFIAVCIGIGALIAFVQNETDPSNQAAAYFRAFASGNYDEMYSYLAIDDGVYVNKEMCAEKMSEIRESMTFDTYSIEEPEKVDKTKQVVIECTDSESGETMDFTVKFTAVRDGFQIIPDYYVNIEDMMVEDFEVVVPENNHLELNGETITEDMVQVTDDDQGNQVYIFEGILQGQYQVSAVNDYYQTEKSVELIESDATVDLTGGDYIANDEYEKTVKSQSEKIIKRFYKAVRNRNTSYKKLLSCFDDNKKLTKKVKTAVSKSIDVVYWPDEKYIDDYQVRDFEMSELKESDISYNAEGKTYTVTYKYSYDYESSTDTALYTSYVYELSGKCKTTMKLTYSLQDDGSIVATDIEVTNKNKKD